MTSESSRRLLSVKEWTECGKYYKVAGCKIHHIVVLVICLVALVCLLSVHGYRMHIVLVPVRIILIWK
jgi:hypothetical protein